MSLIPNIIPPQAFEIIRDKIVQILIDEISNQVSFTYDVILGKVEVVCESINRVDKTEVYLINVNFATGNYEAKDYGSAARANPYQYNIDVYTNSKTIGSIDGSYNSARILQKILGVCRYILENPVYKTLTYPYPFIERVFCSAIDIDNKGKDDADNSMMGRLTFNVVCQENVELLPVYLIQGITTTTIINQSSQGNNFVDNF